MANILLPGDPDFDKPITWNDPLKVDQNKSLDEQSLTPNTKRDEFIRRNSSSTNNGFKYASSMTAYSPDPWFAKMSQATGVSNMMTQPMWFSPLHTPQNWQVASKRREVYQWSFIDGKTPCFLLNYGDFTPIKISDVYANFKNKKEMYIQNDRAERSRPDICTKRYVEKKVNKIKILGLPHALEVTHDHKCMIIKRENIKYTNKQYSKNKNCISGVNAPSCIRAKCDKHLTIDYPISTVNAEDIRKGDYVLCPFPTEVKRTVIKTANHARFAGHLAADGHISQNKKSPGTNVCMNIEEIDYVFPAIQNVFEEYGVLAKLEKCKSDKLKSTRTGNVSLYREFSSKLIIGTKENKRFTEEVMLSHPNLQRHILGAYSKSDGSYNKKNKQIEITTCSESLATQLQIMFHRCGILSFSNVQKISSSSKTFSTKNKKRYFVVVPKSYVYMLYDYIPRKLKPGVYKPFDKNVYKNKKLLGTTNIYFRKGSEEISRINKRFFWKNYVISSVVSNTSRDYKGDVYDVRVPPTYAITANGIAIHQCRFFYEGEPKVAASIDFYSAFPMNGFKLKCPDPKILKFYEHH